jgi:hypothetical protein
MLHHLYLILFNVQYVVANLINDEMKLKFELSDWKGSTFIHVGVLPFLCNVNVSKINTTVLSHWCAQENIWSTSILGLISVIAQQVKAENN